MNNNRSRRQSGSVAIEMAFVFPILFMLSYGAIVYGYTFYLQQSVNFLAEEAARTALANVDPTKVGSADSFAGAFDSAAKNQLAAYQALYDAKNPLKQAGVVTAVKPATATTSGFLNVVVTLPTNSYVGVNGGFAQIALPGIGLFPPLPANLFGIANSAVN